MTVRITYQKALEMMKDEKSLLALNTRREHIALQPKYMGNLKEGVKAMLDSYMSLYQERFDGVPMAYNNIKMVQHTARKIAYQPYLHFDVTVDFIIFKPHVDCCLKGVIQKVEKNHISCLVHGVFNAWCPKDPLLNAVEDPNPLALIGSEIEFKVKKLSSSNGVLSIRGKFQKILKKKSIQIETNTQSTPLNKKVNFEVEEEKEEDKEEEEGDTHDSSDMDRSFCPALTSTQIETPYISTKQGRKRKLSEVIEADLSNELSNSGEIEMDNDSQSNSYTKLKKKKRKKEKHDMEVSKQTETEGSVDDKVPDTSNSKHKKKKKHKHKERRDS